jgi:hypothetical protein
MRKAQDWVIYPCKAGGKDVMIQCENRIARVDLATGETTLSSGKGGHQGFVMLSPIMGAKKVDCPAEVLAELRAHVAGKNEMNPTGQPLMS